MSYIISLNCRVAESMCIVNGYKVDYVTPSDFELIDVINMVDFINRSIDRE